MLVPGTRLGSYETLSLLGSGGMGEVYRAKDTKLGRDVALKTLPASFTTDPERLARFRREAQVLAALNHPHIGAIYGLEEANGQQFLVLELVDGESLDKRIARGPIPVDEALAIATQIAEAVEAAHEQGIIHRDLKPANIKVRPDGTVKVLDFGLAKALESTPASNATVTQSPTITTPAMMTGVGMILGTAAYMSPEQAKGRPADKRSDIWAFGCVLFEMLSAKRAFEGEDVSDTLAAVLRGEPDWSTLPSNISSGVVQALRVCLRKEPKQRLRDISAVRLAIEGAFDIANAPSDLNLHARPDAPDRSPSIWWKVTVGLLALTALGGFAFAYLARSVVPPVTRFSVTPPERTTFVTGQRRATSVAISPDGRTIAFTARDAGGKTLLWVRAIDSLTAQPLAGTDESGFPFWSPDGRFIAYLASGKLMKIAAGGGPPQTVCALTSPLGRGGAWGRNGMIAFNAGAGTGLLRVSSAGGQPASFQRDGGFPTFLPDGRSVLYFNESVGDSKGPGIYVASLDGGAATRLVASDSGGVYDARTGHLLFVREGTLLAQSFNPKTLALTDEPFPIAERVEASVVPGVISFSVSENGILAYGSGLGSSASLKLVWVDRQGKTVGTVGPAANYRGLDLSPDGTRVAAHRHDGQGGDIWLTEVSRDATSRFTFEVSEDNSSPIWSPDGGRIAFGSIRAGKWGLYAKPSNGAGREEQLIETGTQILPMSWSPDGRSIVYLMEDPKTSQELWVLPLAAGGKPTALPHVPLGESHGQISPNGKWLAYQSIASGRLQVYVEPFPSGDGKWQISTTGGSYPRWRHDGRELFFMSSNSGGRMVAVDINTNGSTLGAGAPKELFDSGYINLPGGGRYHPYVVSSDGQRFLIPRPESSDSTTAPIVLVLNWANGIK